MTRGLAALALLTTAVTTIDADDAIFTPSSPPPAIAFVHAINADKGEIIVLYVVSKPVHETKTRTVEQVIDGKSVQKQVAYTVTRMVMETQLRQWSAASAKAFDAKGNALSMADLAKRLKKDAAILLAVGDKVDTAYFKVLKEDAVVLLAPPLAAPAPMPLLPLPPPPIPAKPAPPKQNELSDVEQKVLDLTNAQRKEAGLGALKPHPLLMKAARSHTDNMAKQDMLAHELDGKGPGERVEDLGYKSYGVAENCAAGQRTPAEVVEAWMESEGHKANILGEKYTDIGIGMAKSTDGKVYWTLVFATPAK